MHQTHFLNTFLNILNFKKCNVLIFVIGGGSFTIVFIKSMVQILKDHIILTNKKSGSTNKLCYCKACYNKYGEDHPELKTIVDKTERILTHFKNCPNFADVYSQEEKEEIFSLATQKKTVLSKRPSKFFFFLLIFI